jgi:hypothetical protein
MITHLLDAPRIYLPRLAVLGYLLVYTADSKT